MPSSKFYTFHLKSFETFTHHYLYSLKHNFSVIVLSETWLREASRELCKFPMYNSVYYTRKKGGVSLFIYQDYKFTIMNGLSLKLDKDEVESAFVELYVVFGKKHFIVGVIYRPL